MIQSDCQLRAQALEAYESVTSLDSHGELIRLILTEASLLAEKYRCVRRHDIPHVRELVGLLDVLWQEIEMNAAEPKRVPDAVEVREVPALFATAPEAEAKPGVPAQEALAASPEIER